MSVALAGVIGDPVDHSLSPFLHNAAFEHLGIAARYERWRTSCAELPQRIASLRAPHILGANITLPHKIAVIPLLDRLDPQAEQIGAVNTIVRLPDGQLEGCNTDAPATVATLREEAGFDPDRKTHRSAWRKRRCARCGICAYRSAGNGVDRHQPHPGTR
jgi:shikimate dehydrogenase